MTAPCLATRLKLLALGWAGLACLVVPGQVAAQGLRDPTLAPLEAGVAGRAEPDHAPDTGPGAMTIIVRNGRSFLVVGTRLYGLGQKVGQARIEHIGETEVWFRQGGVLRKVPRFSAIERRTVTAPAAGQGCAGSLAAKRRTVRSATASSSSAAPAAIVPCANVRP